MPSEARHSWMRCKEKAVRHASDAVLPPWTYCPWCGVPLVEQKVSKPGDPDYPEPWKGRKKRPQREMDLDPELDRYDPGEEDGQSEEGKS